MSCPGKQQQLSRNKFLISFRPCIFGAASITLQCPLPLLNSEPALLLLGPSFLSALGRRHFVCLCKYLIDF